MQSVASGWTAEERDPVRRIASNLQVSWKKFSTLGNVTFTIGVSTIGGNGVIGINPGAIGSPSNYQYFDESDDVISLGWERGYNMPIGGLSKALAEAELDNTSGRFTPRYMGGNSELYTSIIPRRPMIINAGFNLNGIDQVIPQFSGQINYPPVVDIRNKSLRIRAADYVDFFQNRYLDQEVMFTAQRTDEVLTTLMSSMGMNTAQYDFDTGINVIPFGLFKKGSRFSDIINQLTQAENGQFYQDEAGVFKFENRQHGDNSPYSDIQRIILTGQVINAQAPDIDNLINVVEIRSNIMSKQQEQIIFRLNPFDNISLPASSETETFIEFESPALSMVTPTSSGTQSYFVANSQPDGSGTDVSSSVTVSKSYKFASSARLNFYNSSAQIAYITNLVVTGRTASSVGELYVRDKDSSSVTAYEERPLVIDNQFIQDEVWASSLARMILNDFGEIENVQKITIRAMPELQLGDLISWQGRYWRIFNIASDLNASSGFIQELILVQRDVVSYFRIGISTIGGSDLIAP